MRPLSTLTLDKNPTLSSIQRKKIVKITVFWDVTPRRFPSMYQRFGGTCHSETSMPVSTTARCHISECNKSNTHRYENPHLAVKATVLCILIVTYVDRKSEDKSSEMNIIDRFSNCTFLSFIRDVIFLTNTPANRASVFSFMLFMFWPNTLAPSASEAEMSHYISIHSEVLGHS